MLKRSSCRGKIFLVSDQMPVDAAVKGVLPFATEGIVFDGNALRSKEGRLAGSARSLVDCMRVAISRFSVPADEAIRMGTEYPARFLGVVEQYGMIDLGRYADFIIADNQLNIHAVFRNGMRLV
jgi:N-acetylglucosamine-6-phosphate deacetylase